MLPALEPLLPPISHLISHLPGGRERHPSSLAAGLHAMADAGNAKLRWELENDVQQQAGGVDELFRFDAQEQQQIQQQRPWTRDPHYFKK